MDYTPFSDNAARQVIDSTTLFEEYHRVRSEARKYEGACIGRGRRPTST